MTFQFSSTMATRPQRHLHNAVESKSKKKAACDIDALLIQYKRNNIGFPFPHPLRSAVYSSQFTVDSLLCPVADCWGYLREFF